MRITGSECISRKRRFDSGVPVTRALSLFHCHNSGRARDITPVAASVAGNFTPVNQSRLARESCG